MKCVDDTWLNEALEMKFQDDVVRDGHRKERTEVSPFSGKVFVVWKLASVGQ